MASGPYAELDAKLAKARNSEQAVALIRDQADARGGELGYAIEQIDGAKSASARSRAVHAAREIVSLMAQAERVEPVRDASALAADIERSPLYADRGAKDESNWLGVALERLKNLRFDPPKGRQVDTPNFSIGPWFTYVMWTLLAALVLGLAYFAFRHFNWRQALERKAKMLVEEDEPERSLDEWLEMADRLAREGRHREAVRALYLSCLLQFDQARVARFDRGQTNWEHLARIHQSARRPADLDFLPPTQAFDRIWYGKMVRGPQDVDQFRAWYTAISGMLRERAAA